MTVSILMPFRAGNDKARRRNANFVSKHYAKAHPDWEFLSDDSGEGPWSKGRALNKMAEKAQGDILVLADADSLVDKATLDKAVWWAETTHAWVSPHSDVYRLTEDASTKFMEDFDSLGDMPDLGTMPLDRPNYRGYAGGGIVVVQASLYAEIHGCDDRFEGWGGEDVTLGWMLSALGGRPGKIGSPLMHLWHGGANRMRRGSIANEELVARYQAALNDGIKMIALIDERPELQLASVG